MKRNKKLKFDSLKREKNRNLTLNWPCFTEKKMIRKQKSKEIETGELSMIPNDFYHNLFPYFY